jgi:hypothetical protein
VIAIPHGLAASPMPSRFAVAPLDSRRIVWHRGQPISIVIEAGHLVYVGPPRDLDLALRPRRRGQRPAGMPRSEWWGQRRGKRRQIGGAP